MTSSIENALVVDDDVLMRDFIVETLRRANIAVTQAGNGSEALKLMAEQDFDLAFIDLKMPGMDGMQLLTRMKKDGIGTLPVMVTAFGTVEQAVDAMKMGAVDFLMKPFSPEQVELVVKRARDWVGLQNQAAYLQEELGWTLPRGRQFLGESAAMQTLKRAIEKVAASSATALISGESGTGKELVALAVHFLSERKERPFVRLNCAAVPDALMDSELFGHEKGAFTGALSRRAGRFELAQSGSLLLDEISEMKLELQGKLLRVLQEQEFERVGGSRTLRTDCRVMATTNRDLAECVRAGTFRQDLYYRLNVVPLRAPPLRERREDIPLLAKAFLTRFKKGQNAYFSAAALDKLQQYDWPGNVRELENAVERVSVMEPGPEMGVDTLAMLGAEPTGRDAVNAATMPPPNESDQGFDLAAMERQTILRALRVTHGSRQEAADRLGISVRTLRNKINQYRKEGSLAQNGDTFRLPDKDLAVPAA
jgi:two-component system, NtrC family, response regulator AtoC